MAAGTGIYPAKDLRQPPGTAADQATLDDIRKLEWPPATTKFISRFVLATQYRAGDSHSSGYHLGNGYIGTAGHCVVQQLLDGTIQDQRMVFGWAGEVDKVKFSVFEVERCVEASCKKSTVGIVDLDNSVVLCDAPGKYDDDATQNQVAKWARR